MKNKFLLLLFVLLAGVSQQATASHVSGGYFSYTCISGNTYQVCLTLWRDCSGATAPQSIPLSLTSNCGGSASVTLTQTATSGVEVSQLCAQQLPNSRCVWNNTAALKGFQQYTYCGTVTLNPACANWNMLYTLCCRNSATNLVGQTTFALTGSINNFNASCPNNNSPVFTSQPIPYVCTGQQVNFNPSILEPDGDSLVFTLISPLTSATATAAYQAANGFGANNPFNTTVPTSFNTATGQLTFTPNTPGNYVVVIQVCEWRNGVQLGCAMREFQIVVQTCNNIVPTMPTGIDSFQGSGTVIDSNSVLVCVGDSFSFSLLFVDSLMAAQTVGDSITITTNASLVLPGANVTVVNGNPAWMQITWLTTPGSPSFNIFTVTIQDDACPIPGQNTYQFDISVIPATYAGPDQTICGYQDTAHINVVGGDTFTWSVLAGEPIIPGVNFRDTTGLTGTPVWAKPSVTTTYQVVSNLFGQCVNTDTITVFVREIDLPNDTILCKGDTMTLDVYNTIPCGTGTELYFWSPTIGLDNPNVRNPLLTIQPNQSSTMYYLVYDDGCGCQTQDSFMVHVSDIDMANTLVNKYLCNTADGEITISPVGGYSPYEFSIDSGLNFIAGNFFDNLDIGIYDVIVRDSVGCWSPVKIDTILDPGAPLIDSVRLQDVSCFAANDGEIEIFGSGGLPPYTFSNDSGTTYQVSNLFTNLAFGNYFIQMRDDSLCRSLPQEVFIGSNAQMFVDSIIKTDLLCFEENFGQIRVYGSGGTPPLTYSVNNGATYQSSNIFNNLAAGTYIVYIRDAKGCLTDPQVITLMQPTKLQLSMNVLHDTCFEACGGRSSVIVSGGVMPYSFNWYGHGSNSNTSNNLCAGGYQFRVTDNNGCFIDTGYVVNEPAELVFDSVVYDNLSCNGNTDGFIRPYVSGGRPPYNYSIDGGQNYTTNPNFNGLDAGTYQVIVYDSGFRCMNATTVTLVEPSKVNLTVPTNQHKICVSTCVNLVANGSGGNGAPYTYHWTGLNGNTATVPACPQQDTVYAVYVEDRRGCVSNVELIRVDLYDSLRVQTSPDADICPGESTEISAIGSGGMGTGYTYTWSPTPTLSSPFTASTMATPFVTQNYVVKLTDNCGSPAVYDTVTVTVHPIPTPDFMAEGAVEGCEPFDVTLLNLTNPAQFCSWTIGNRATATGFTVNVLDLPAGKYDVTLTVRSPQGCVNTVTMTDYLTVIPKPIAKFSMTPNPTTVFNTIIQFQDESSSDVVLWDWDFSGLGFSDVQNPVYQYPSDTGIFPIRLKVTSIDGCESSVENLLRIGAEYNMFIPTAFTPNGDGLNDVFSPVGLGVDPSKFSMVVYDRWGNLVFESNSLGEPWDGSIKGKNQPAPNGTYVWKVFANSLAGDLKNYEYTGIINLIR